MKIQGGYQPEGDGSTRPEPPHQGSSGFHEPDARAALHAMLARIVDMIKGSYPLDDEWAREANARLRRDADKLLAALAEQQPPPETWGWLERAKR
jgi:hypothetical protein